MPVTAFNRLADNWRPLLAIAQVAGGEWPERACRAFADLTRDNLDSKDTGLKLLSDIRTIFFQSGQTRLFSKQIVDALWAIPGSPWHRTTCASNGSSQWLANRLRPFRVTSRNIQIR